MKLFKVLVSLVIGSHFGLIKHGYSTDLDIPEKFVMENLSKFKEERVVSYLGTDLIMIKYQSFFSNEEISLPSYHICKKDKEYPLSPKVYGLCSNYLVYKIIDIRDNSTQCIIGIGWGKPFSNS